MQLDFEILNTYAPKKSCNSLLYTPTTSTMTARQTRLYSLEVEGDADKARAFVRSVLADDVSDEVHEGPNPALSGYAFYLDVGLKPGCLDLEKEYILRFYRELEAPGFEVKSLTLRQRTYLMDGNDVPAERFVHDIVNPVIHSWNVHHA